MKPNVVKYKEITTGFGSVMQYFDFLQWNEGNKCMKIKIRIMINSLEVT
jgi:hypothetical protein